jgi:hypothetical protein
MNERSVEEVIIQQFDNRDYHLAELNHPIGRGRAQQVETNAPELLFLAIERQTVDIFGAGDMGQERRRGIALRQDLRWFLNLMRLLQQGQAYLSRIWRKTWIRCASAISGRGRSAKRLPRPSNSRRISQHLLQAFPDFTLGPAPIYRKSVKTKPPGLNRWLLGAATSLSRGLQRPHALLFARHQFSAVLSE